MPRNTTPAPYGLPVACLPLVVLGVERGRLRRLLRYGEPRLVFAGQSGLPDWASWAPLPAGSVGLPRHNFSERDTTLQPALRRHRA